MELTKQELQEENEELRAALEGAYDQIGEALGVEDDGTEEADDQADDDQE